MKMSATSMSEYLNRLKRTVLLVACICILSSGFPAFGEQDHKVPTYEELRTAFTTPDHATWGEVPLWWWEGETMTKERATAELEKLAAKGVKAVCPIQRSPGRSDPASFTPEWWDMFAHVNQESKRLGMTLWAYDQVGYGHYGWLEKAASRIQDPRTSRISFQTAQADAKNPVQMTLPEGKVLSARAYPVADGQADDAQSIDMTDQVSGNTLAWTPREGAWRVAVMVAEPYQSFYLSDTSADEFIDMFYGKIERTLGKASMGDSFVGIFQDEHPPTPRDIYTDELARAFKKEHGYELTRAIPAQHFDVGPLTPKYRNDYFDTYLRVVEDTYWKKIYDWTWDRGLLTSHDNWGRRDIYRQSQGYIDYFRSQRWYSAPALTITERAPSINATITMPRLRHPLPDCITGPGSGTKPSIPAAGAALRSRPFPGCPWGWPMVPISMMSTASITPPMPAPGNMPPRTRIGVSPTGRTTRRCPILLPGAAISCRRDNT